MWVLPKSCRRKEISSADLAKCSTAATVETLIAVTKAIPTILKRVPKHPRIPLVKHLNEALDGIVAKPQDGSCWLSFVIQFFAIMKQPKRSGKQQISDLGSIICERINKSAAFGDLVVPREMPDS